MIFVEVERQATFPILRSNFLLADPSRELVAACLQVQLLPVEEGPPGPDGPGRRASAIGSAQVAPASSDVGRWAQSPGAGQGGSSPLAAQVGRRPRPGKMPLGLRRKRNSTPRRPPGLVEGEHTDAAVRTRAQPPAPARRLVFHTQLAHGSATGRGRISPVSRSSMTKSRACLRSLRPR